MTDDKLDSTTANGGTLASEPAVVVHETLSSRVLNGRGAVDLVGDEVDRAQGKRALLVATPSAGSAAERVADSLGSRLAARFDRPAPHTPVAVTTEVMNIVEQSRVDSVIAIGGGSAIGLAKAVSARTHMPQIAVPTTYAGSEATPVLGETEGGVKRTRRDPALAPGTVIYDPELTISMPVGLTRTSALNALAHAVEALWAPNATPVTDALATESVTGILAALPEVLADPSGSHGRRRLQQAAWLAGTCLAQSRMGLHHQLAHLLGGAFDLPHAELHSMLLAHVMAFNRTAAPVAFDRLTQAAGRDPVTAVSELARGHQGPNCLAALEVEYAELGRIADLAATTPYPNPRPLTTESVQALLDRVWRDRLDPSRD